MKAQWPSGRASDSGARGPGFDPHSGRRVVSLSKINLHKIMKAQWPSGRSSVGLWSERSWVRSSLRSACCILEQDTFTSQKVLVIPRKRWLCPDMTEKLLTGTQSLNPNKQQNKITTNIFTVGKCL